MSDLERIDRKQLRRLLTARSSDTRAVVLIGSYARGTAVRPVSDLDILVIGDDMPEPESEAHVVVVPPDRFEARIRAGDDFAQWALRYGIALSGRDWWDKARRRLEYAPWPNSHKKYQLAEKRLVIIEDLLAMGDYDAAQLELRLVLSLIARGVLLDSGIFPLSRPELPSQLESIGHDRLAAISRDFSAESSLATVKLTEAARYARRAIPAIHRAHRDTAGVTPPSPG